MALVWTTSLKGGPKKVNHAAAVVGKNIYSFGGYCSQEDMHGGEIDVYVLSTATNRWRIIDNPTGPSESASIPFQRFGHTAVAHGKNIYIWGGKNESMACNRLFCFDTVTNKWSCPPVQGNIPGARDGHSACVIDNKMYVFGGFADDFHQYTDDLHVLDLNTMTWSFVQAKGEKPSCRDFHSVAVVNGKMYLFGGRGGINEPFYTKIETYDNNMYIYDPQTQFWDKKIITNAPIGRRSMGMVALDKRIYMFGGYNGIKDSYYNDLYYYDTELDEWSGEIKTYGAKPCERRRHCTVLVNNQIYVFGGTSSIDRYYSELEELYLGLNYFDDKCWINFDDLHVLDLNPTLATLSKLAVIEHKLCTAGLPQTVQREIMWMVTDNKVKNKPRAQN